MRNRYILLADILLIPVAAFAAFTLRFEWLFYPGRPEFTPYVAAALLVKPMIDSLLTHPEMKRFFMTIPEAVHLVLQAGGMGQGGELYVSPARSPRRPSIPTC